MKEIKVFNTELSAAFKADLSQLIHDFESIEGGVGKRNIIKTTTLNSSNLNIKAFKVPHLFNQIVYRFFRKSKAQRSFEYAHKLTKMKVGTPKPLAYFEYLTPWRYTKSFYLSEHLECDLTYRELTTNFNYPDYETILRAFTRFTYSLHEKGIHFLDHSPGNTLIKKNGDTYDFYLVDLNRMAFRNLDFESRIRNFAKLTIHRSMVEVMSDEYAKCSGEDYQRIVDLMWKATTSFQYKFHRKKRLKKKLKFWKNT
ncbi:lipopolysaccharide kinase InaA family protein [Aestuariivivens sediminicola]|uniref:lipopolysaccharide kinase InaA family protein n=1 Tax=Aestuariivivens sediminicola TaxID=2913560 RepID=UPI001F597D7E